jgi:hypothetical protein
VTARGAAGALAVASLLDPAVRQRARLVVVRTRRGGLHPDDLADLTGLEIAAVVGFDQGLAAAVERGEGPRVGRGTPLGRLAATLTASLDLPARRMRSRR